MARLDAVVACGADEARARLHHHATEQGWRTDWPASAPHAIVFRKDASLVSWGAELLVTVAETTPGQTYLTITPAEILAITDWGRGRRAAKRLVTAIGGTPVA